MIQFLLIMLSLLEFWILFTICYALSKKTSEGKSIIDKILPTFTMFLLLGIYVLINLHYFL